MVKIISSINYTHESGYAGNLIIINDTSNNYNNWSLVYISQDESSNITDIDLQLTNISRNVFILSPLFNTPSLKANSSQTFIFKGKGEIPNKFTFFSNSNSSIIDENNYNTLFKKNFNKKRVSF